MSELLNKFYALGKIQNELSEKMRAISNRHNSRLEELNEIRKNRPLTNNEYDERSELLEFEYGSAYDSMDVDWQKNDSEMSEIIKKLPPKVWLD